MAGKHATLTQVKQIIALRGIGATQAVISLEVGVSLSTVARVCKRHSANKGVIRHKLIQNSQHQLVDALTNDTRITNAIASQLADDLESTRIMRDKITEAVRKLSLDDTDHIANSLRALNSAASALATAQKVGRIATGIDNEGISGDDLPVLEIRGMTAEEVKSKRVDMEKSENELLGDDE